MKEKQSKKIQWTEPTLITLGSAQGQSQLCNPGTGGAGQLDCNVGGAAANCNASGNNAVSCFATGAAFS